MVSKITFQYLLHTVSKTVILKIATKLIVDKVCEAEILTR